MVVLARASANQGRLSDALAWCEKAVAADRLNPVCHYLRSVILLECGAIREAVKCLRQTLYLDRRFVLAHVGLGTHARREGRFQESTKHFENALSLLRTYRPEDFVPEAEGMTVKRMEEILQATLRGEGAR
jgi:chemotaxis protein methyltransferase CheR